MSNPMLFGRHIAELNFTNNSLVRTYVWGLDLSGTMDGAGGVSGLLWVNQHTGPSAGAHFCAYDGNGNVVALVSANTGTETARYEYGPFGESVRVTGTMSKENPFRFSTKRTCNMTDLVLYEYCACSPGLGRWLSRDVIEERSGGCLYAAMRNEPVNLVDFLGLDCVGHACKPGEARGYDEGRLHFCSPPSPPPPRRTNDPPGFNRVPPYNPPDAGEPCCVDTAILKKAKRTDPPPTMGSRTRDSGLNWTIHIKLGLEIEGLCKDLPIYWTTCWRIDGTSGVIPTCSNKTACDFPTITYGKIGGPYVTTARIFWLSCEGGRWTKKKHIASGGYTFDGKWDFTTLTK